MAGDMPVTRRNSIPFTGNRHGRGPGKEKRAEAIQRPKIRGWFGPENPGDGGGRQ
jgi:hypothetical protein